MKEKKKKRRKYSPEFKITVIMDMKHNHLSYRETIRKYWNTSGRSEEDLYKQTVKQWERIYLTEGQKGFMIERRGRKSTGRPRKKPLDKEIKKDLVAENQRLKERLEYLEMENEYLKKLDALVRLEEQQDGKKRKQ